MKLFDSKGIRAKGVVLPLSDFKLFRDMIDPALNPQKAKKVIELAEKDLDFDIPFLPLSLYREYHINGNRSNFERQYFKRRSMALNLALAEHIEQKGRFTEKLSDVIFAILEESTWLLPAHLYVSPYHFNDGVPPVFGENSLHGVDLFAATTAATLTVAIEYAKDALDSVSKVIIDRTKYALHERIIKPFLFEKFWWTGETGRRVNNWAPWIVSNVLLVAAMTEEDMTTREACLDRSLYVLDNFIDAYLPDGGCDEGPSYWSAAGASLFDSLELIEDLTDGKIAVYDNELIKNIGEYIYKVNIHGDQFVNFADCRPTLKPTPSLLHRYGEKCNSAFLRSFAKKMAEYGDFGIDSSYLYRSIKNLYYTVEPNSSIKMPKHVFLKNIGIMAVRESHDSSMGAFMAIKGGHNAESHNHNDLGNFIIYSDGRPVLIDAGVGTYTKQTFSADRYKLWFMQSGYHNLPSFGGTDQMNGREFEATVINHNEEENSLALDLIKAYPSEAKLKSYTRNATLKDSIVRITDSFEYNDDAINVETDFHFLCAEQPKQLSRGVIQLAQGKKLCYNELLEPEIEAFEPIGLDATDIWKTSVLYRIHLRSTERIATYEFVIK